MNYKSLFLIIQLGRQDEFTTEIIQAVGHGFISSFGLSLMSCVKFEYLPLLVYWRSGVTAGDW